MHLGDGIPLPQLWSANQEMTPEALIYSRDEKLGEALSTAVGRMKLQAVCASRAGAALNMLRSRKFPAVIVDCQDKPAATDLFELCRRSGSNKTSVVFALTGADETALSWGVTFAVKRPVDLDLRAFNSTLRTAEGMILQDFRRYRRIPIESFALLDNDEHRLQLATVNLSESGMCVHGEIAGWNREHLVQFHAEMGLRFQANSYLVWSRNGRSGIHFRFMTTASRKALSGWLAAR